VAAGIVSPSVAIPLGVGLLLAGLLTASLTGSWAPVGVLALYAALQPAYTYWLKHVVVVDMIVVSAGFVLRAIAGVVGTEVPISDWYLIVASFGSLFLVAGKRAAELRLGDGAGDHRPLLDVYTPTFLLLVRAVTLSITLLAYCLWAFEKATVADTSFPWFELSIVPFTALLLRYVLAQETSALAGPEDIVLRDRQLQAIGLVWTLCVGAGVYVAGAPPLSG
jgi:decaprenyl-phosphate phosphoribosyltransferase